MINLEALARKNPKKLNELETLHWFLQAARIDLDAILVDAGGLTNEESPDFRVRIGARVVGLELTTAYRRYRHGGFSAQQVEAAQNAFAAALKHAIRPALPIIIILNLADEIAVDPKAQIAEVASLADEIEEISRGMATGSSVTLLPRTESEARRKGARLYSDLPRFLYSIQIYNDGQNFTAVTASRGGVAEDFTELDLMPILEKKHKALEGYRPCDEHWLIIASRMSPPLAFAREQPNVLLPSISKTFGRVKIARPIKSRFDRVYFFESPTDAICLTDDA